MITVGSITREKASSYFPFLAKKYRGRRKEIKKFTHIAPDFVFWIYPNGVLLDAVDSHRKNPPKGYEFILNDKVNYGGFLRGNTSDSFESPRIKPCNALRVNVQALLQLRSVVEL